MGFLSLLTGVTQVNYFVQLALTLSFYCILFIYSPFLRHNLLTFISTDKCKVSNKVHVRMYQFSGLVHVFS